MEYMMKINYLIISTLVILTGCDDSDSNYNIDVYISTGELQCQENGLSISETKGYLLDANIEVKSESCGHLTEINYAEVCGGETGNLHVFSISIADENTAENLGFTIPDNTISEDDYEKEDCSV
ncbi:hypothetical protein KO525_03695 [Psychrosphaera sp. B3R10]|uniref:hypothetical protein n=1 Tax=unclassified Psychrosphaera TaxID=2641570 RepID=UPI001C0A49BB|nr:MULTISPECIES: hypothetical protein [unclassified Psychrosphaera]MBU2881381.1 hypothetical protein [Psychrosphaera sp. I2R16]MBU2988480.1 hypothetical protein [Psychrosphaera sp. B3R10]